MATRPTAETPSREDQLMELTLQLRNSENAKKYAQFHGDSLISNKIPDKVGLLGDLTAALAPSNWGAWGDIAGSLLPALLTGKPVDEPGLAQVAGSLSNDSTNRERLINDQVRKKYDKMLHPPLTYLGDAFQYRTADGSFNSALNPHLGQAGAPYAKTVPSKTAPLGALPDPEVLFDRLMAREAGGRQSQSGLSSMLLYHATIIIHDIFRTNDDDKNISDSSSYLDLSPLYGYNEGMVRKVRDDKYKLGLLKPDTFAEDRLLRQPPGVCIMLVMYNRYHNYAARQLLRINENGRFSLPEMYSGTRLVALIKEHLPDRDDQGVKIPLDSKVKLLCNQYEDLWGKVRAARPPDAPDAPKKQDSETPEQTAVREAAEKKRKAALDLITAFESELLYTKFADVERQLKQKLKEKGNKLERESPALLKSFEKKCKDFKMAWQAAWDKQDDDLFNTARLITQGMYVNISIHDYLRTLMGFHQFDTNFTLDPRKDFDQKKTTRGIGNQVTVEFNLLYRFHCAISLRDEKYTEEYMKTKLGIEHPEHLSLPEFLKVMSYEKQKGTKVVEPWEVTFGVPDLPAPKTTPGSEDGQSTERSRNNSDSGISLGSTGEDVEITKAKAPAVATPSVANSKHFERNEITNLFDDEQMLNELTAAMDEPLSNFGPRNVPKCLKPVEMMGIMQARKWEVGTLNDFRRFFDLPVHTTFESVSANPDIQNTLRDLYESPDKIELYPGIFCEGDAKMSLDPGPAESTSALWAAIFSDAITLVRSDRFYTVDWNTQSLTAWGMKEVTPDNKVCKSSVFHRLIQRAFPGWLPRDSLRWFSPFYTAKQNAIYAEQQGYASQFKETAKLELRPYFDRAKAAARIVACPPEKPHKPCYLDNFEDIKVVLKDQSDHFTNPVFSYKANLPRGLREVLDWETARPVKFDPNILKKHVKSVEKDLKTYLLELMTSIIKRESVSITKAEFQIDATRDFAIPVVTRYMAAFLGFSHKLREVPATCTVSDKRTQTAHHGTYTENEIYQHITNCQVFLAYNTDETKWMARRKAFQKSVETLIELARQGTIWEAKQIFGLSNMLYGREETNPMHQMGVFVAKQILKHEPDQTRAAAILLLISLDFTYNAVVSFTATLDGFMEDLYQVANGDNMEAEPKWLALQRAALVDEDNIVEKMVLDMARAKVNLPIVRKVLKEGQFKFVGVPYKGKSTTLKEGQHVVLDLAPATASAVEAQDTSRLKFLTLQLSIADKYAVFSPRDFIPLSQAQMIKFIALTRNTRRGPAAQGELKRVHLEATAEGYANYMAPERVEWIKEQVDKLEDQTEASRIFNDKIFVAGFDTFLTPSWDEYVPFPMTWKIRFDGFGKSDYINQECKNVKYGQVRTVGKGLPDFCPPWYQPKGPSSTGGTFAIVKCVCADGAASGCSCSSGKAGRRERAPKPMAMSSGCKVGP
ncbi:Putative hem peroxidase superfamily, hem peroxidase, animal-type [Colletotrichum destructivum]|uniref:Hem peroxidase superfamily, hem peroxidase, animal-type n=1 Tax=Colletotrichum destructivum TaxID=34406 RepID=A0AAX4HVF2_9PEZI|nr:Putative hem peroxidase superfamily, hem peroxidase, animal-type [Colletotrichum destructivum]